MVFFGTPHSGPTNDLKVKFGKACVAIAQSLPWSASNDTMEALKKGSLFSDILTEQFRHQLENYRILFFYEGFGSVSCYSFHYYACSEADLVQLVPRESAVLGLAGLREQQLELRATHSDMCRFDPDGKIDKINYFLVSGNIADLCDHYPGGPRQPPHVTRC